MKILLGLLIVIVIGVLGAGFYIANNMNGLVKDAVEEVGSQVLKTPVRLKAVNIQLLQGRAEISGLTIANPSGFDQPNVFQMDKIAVELDLISLMDSVVNLKEISIEGASVIAEQKGLGTNLQALMKNLQASSDDASDTVAADDSSSPDLLIKVGLFQFINSSTSLVSEKWGQSEVSIPEIKLVQRGGEQGLPPQQLAEALLKPLMKQLSSAVEAHLKGLFERKFKEKLDEKEDELKKKLSNKIADELGDDSDDRINSLKSLLSR